jgi:hypothetical protein
MMFGVGVGIGVGFCGDIIGSPTKKPIPTPTPKCFHASLWNFPNDGTPERLSLLGSHGQRPWV